MQQYFGISAMVVICSLLATIVYIGMRKEEKRYSFYVFSAFLAAYYFMLSAMKYYLGYRNENLFESFWDAQNATYVHYGIPLIVVSVIVPVALHFVFKDIACKIIRFFDSVMFLVLSFAWLLVREINNRTYCIVFLVALVISVIAIGYLKKNELKYVWGKDTKKHFTSVLPFILYWLIAVAIYIPNELYLNNASDFPMSYWYFFGLLLLGSIIAVIILLCGMMIYLTEKQMNIFCTLLFILLIVGYIQGMFLNGSMGVLDGTGQSWDVGQYVLNLAIWIVLAAVISALRIWKKEKAHKIMQIICIWLALTQVVSLGVLMLSSDGTEPKSELVLTTDGMMEVGESDNIIVFVLDKFDGRRMDEILEEAPDFLEPLKDFTYYINATSEFSPTENSIPFLLTGTEYQENNAEKYVTYAYDKEALIKDISNKGYDIGLYTHTRYVPEEMKDIVSNYEDNVQRTCNMWDLFSVMTQGSRYRMAPFIAKNYYQYDSSDIELLVVNDKITNIENDLPFYNKLISEGLCVSEDAEMQSAFRFIHMHGAHPPYIMTEDFQYLEYDARRDDGWGSGVSQAKGALKIVYEYIEQLKALGKYDDATIVITADHGYTERLSDKGGNMQDVSLPILFVKEPYDNNTEQMKINNAPVCHADIISTLESIIGVENEENTLKEISEKEERVRTLKICSNELYQKYEINGDVRKLDSWQFVYSNEKYEGSVIGD